MPRNRSEKVTPEHEAMMATLHALRKLVRLTLADGARPDFAVYHLVTPKQQFAADVYHDAANKWNPWAHLHAMYLPGTGWPGLLRGVEAYVKEQLGAHHGLTEASTPGITA